MTKNNANNKEKSSFWRKLGLGKSKSSITSLKSEIQQQQQGINKKHSICNEY
jgi:hypothetical protein